MFRLLSLDLIAESYWHRVRSGIPSRSFMSRDLTRSLRGPCFNVHRPGKGAVRRGANLAREFVSLDLATMDVTPF